MKTIYAIVFTGDNPDGLQMFLQNGKMFSMANISALTFNQVSAVVGDYSGNGSTAGKLAAIGYARIIEGISDSFNLLPMRFGSVTESEEHTLKMLRSHYDVFVNTLKKTENKDEFGLKVFCNSMKMRAFIKEKLLFEASEQPQTGQMTENSVFRDYINKKLEEHRLEERMLQYTESIIAEIISYLKNMNPEHKIKKMVSPSNIIDAVFLMEKQHKTDLVKTIEDFQNRYPELIFMLSGPWPPYNFTNITLK